MRPCLAVPVFLTLLTLPRITLAQYESDEDDVYDGFDKKPARRSHAGAAGNRPGRREQRLSNAAFCSKREADAQARLLLGRPQGSALDLCQQQAWMDDLRDKLASESAELTFLQIGCNYGYDALKVFSTFAGAAGVAPADLHSALQAASGSSCGACNECESTLPASPRGPRDQPMHVQLFSVEPDATAHKALEGARGALLHRLKEVDWELQHLTIGSADDMLDVPGASHGATTLDLFVTHNRLETVHMLQLGRGVDVPKVLAGGQVVFGQRKVQLLTFEYDSREGRKGWSIMKATITLYRSGYMCWAEAKGGNYARLSACWSRRYDQVVAMRVLCVHDSHPLRGVLEKKSLDKQVKGAALLQLEAEG